MKKTKFIALICVFALLITNYSFLSVFAAAKNTSLEERYYLLSSLGILESETVNPDKNITRGEFAGILTALNGMKITVQNNISSLSDVDEKNPYAEDIETALALGQMEKLTTTEFKPEKSISFKDVLKAFAMVIGYPKDDNRDLTLLAVKSGLLKGVSYNPDSAVSFEKMCIMLENLLDAKAVEQTSFSTENGIIYEESKTKTVLQANLKIFKEEGIVEANYFSNINNGNESNEKTLMIDGVVYSVSSDKYYDYLGRKVKFWYKETEDGIYEILYIKNVCDDELGVKSEQIDSVSDKQFKYFDGNKRKTLKLPNGLNVIYNGYAVSSYNTGILKPKDGSVTFVDNDGSGSYDTVYITDYINFYINNVNVDEKIIYGPGGEKIKLEDKTKLMRQDGVQINAENIQRGMIACVQNTYTGEAVNVIVSKNIVTGKVQMVSDKDGERHIKVNNSDYIINDGVAETSKVKIEVGFSGTFYLSIGGRIVYVKSNKGKQFAYLVKAVKEEGLKDEAALKLYETDGNMHYYRNLTKLKINGIMRKNADAILSALGGDKKVILAEYDEEGNISGAETAYNYPAASRYPDTEQAESDRLRIIYSDYVDKNDPTKMTYKSTVGAFGGKVVLSGSTVYFEIPMDEDGAAEDDYNVTEGPLRSFSNDIAYSLEAYSVRDDSYTADAILRYKKTGLSDYTFTEGESPAKIVKGIEKTLNSEGATVYQITFSDWRSSQTFKTTENIDLLNVSAISDENDKAPLRVGDVVYFLLNKKNEICRMVTMCRVGKNKGEYHAFVQQGYTGGTRIVDGCVYDCSNDYIALALKDNIDGKLTREDYEIHSLSRPDIQIYDSEKKEVYYGTSSDIISYKDSTMDYSRIFMYSYAAIPLLIVIYK